MDTHEGSGVRRFTVFKVETMESQNRDRGGPLRRLYVCHLNLMLL